jgi:hypothetical protein
MADVASILAEFQAGVEGKDTGLGATIKFDFRGCRMYFS